MEIEKPTIGEWLRSLIPDGVLIQAVADGAGCRRSSLSDILNGKMLPTSYRVHRICETCGVPERAAEGDAILARCQREREAARGAA